MSCEVYLNINEGDLFNSLHDIEAKLFKESKEKFVQFYKKEAKKIDPIAKTVKRYLNPSLIYYHITWACVFGGRPFKSRGKGIRKSRTLRKEDICGAQITVRVAVCGNKCIVIKARNIHNHLVNESLFRQLPQQRHLPAKIEDAKKLIRLKVNKQLLKEELENKLNTSTPLKDLTNLQCENLRGYSNDIQVACEKVQTKFVPKHNTMC